MIEYCCDANRALSNERYKYTETGCIAMIRLTVEHDLTTKEGSEYARSIVEKYRKLPAWLWCSVPCTGGSALQKQNEHLPNHAKKMREHNELFKKLHRNFMGLARFMTKEMPYLKIAYEWPRHNTWWERIEVTNMCKEFELKYVNFDGCTLGVKSERGNPKLKPWRFATNSYELRN